MINIDSSVVHQPLKQRIVKEIARSKNRCISFARFMEMALLTAHSGYYQTPQPILGWQGDFTTAPEISSWFGHCLANYCLPILQALSSHTSVIMEIGPGTGRLAADILLRLEQLNCLPSRYVLVETSDYLRKQQQRYLMQHIPHLIDYIEYHATLPKEPIEGIILANEVIDVLPIHRFGIEKGNVYEYHVGWDVSQFTWQKRAPTPRIKNHLKEIQARYLEGVSDYSSEVRLSLVDWFASAQACLASGCMIVIDYGRSAQEYYHPMRYTGTLRCYYQHRFNTEPLKRVGLQDITSEVDFTQLANLAMQANLQLEAFTTQSAFLLVAGILDAFQSKHSDDAAYLQLKSKINQLLSPLEMGESCKVMILKRKLHSDLLSLEAYDKRFTL